MTRQCVAVALGCASVALLLAAAWINLNILTEAYGAGPPYYSLTTNMDKWTNPLPYLISLDIAVLGLTAIIIRFSIRSIRKTRSQSDA